MLKNYFTIAIRGLFRNSLFSFINIFGLALSMSVCLLVLMRLKDQLSYDQFHPQPDRTYRVITQLTNKEGNIYRFASTPMPLAATILADYNFTDAVTRLYTAGWQTAVTGKKSLHINTAFTEPSFFSTFGFTLQQGDAHMALQEPNSIVLSRETALKFFGREDVTGQIIQLEQWGDFRVTGVMNKPGGKSHIDFDAYTSLASVPALEKSGKLRPVLGHWDNVTSGYTYVQLKKGVTEQQLTGAINQVAASLMKTSTTTGKESISFETQPLNKIILGEELAYSLGNTGSRSKTWSEVTIAFVILLMACFNYTNLSIARSLKRGKEVGIRKVAGALRYQVFTRFIVESVLTALLSLALAYVFLELIINYAPFASEMVPPGASIDRVLFVWFLLFSLFTGLLAGILPAWALSSFNPVEVLKNLSAIRLFGGNGFRKTLTVAQFALSLFIIIFTVIFSRQFNYMATSDPGFRRDNLLTIPLKGGSYTLLSAAISQLNGVEQVSASSALPGKTSSGRSPVKRAPGSEAVQMDYLDIDAGFISNMGLQLLAGATFPAGNPNRQEQYVVVNEKVLEVLNIKAPAEAIGRQLWINDTVQLQIAGVVKDFYFQGLETSVRPLLLRNRPADFNFLNVRTTSKGDKTLVTAIGKIWKTYNPEQPFEYAWLKDELYDRQSAWSTVSLLGFLAIISITIACLGLLGMVTYTTETRRKEIGIRKVMGADAATIVLLLSKGFVKLVIIAGVIALPVSYIAGYLFLNIFANRITINIGMLAGSFIGLLLLVISTIGIQVYRVAVANPVNSLRTE